MTTLFFPRAEVAAVAAAAHASRGQVKWAKDAGTYLAGWPLPPAQRPVVTHAWTGHGQHLRLPGPDHPDWEAVYDTTAAICGGDDFVERIDPDMVMPFGLARAYVALTLEVTPDTFSLAWVTGRGLPGPLARAWQTAAVA